ncbi:hypothetical protein BD560DRAFT_403123 [Blakeslea trispora]|nr:hypothetical protein BD560DRAFT_403123 [Blakeslea trispora]
MGIAMFECILCKTNEIGLIRLSSMKEAKQHFLDQHMSEFSGLDFQQRHQVLAKLACESLVKMSLPNTPIQSLGRLEVVLKKERRSVTSKAQTIRRNADRLADSFDDPLSSFKYLLFTIRRLFVQGQPLDTADNVQYSLIDILYICFHLVAPYAYQNANQIIKHWRFARFLDTHVTTDHKVYRNMQMTEDLKALIPRLEQMTRTVVKMKAATLAFLYNLGIARLNSKSQKTINIDAKPLSISLQESYCLRK